MRRGSPFNELYLWGNGEPEWEDEHGRVDNAEGDEAGLMPQSH